MEIASLGATRRYLQNLLGISVKKYHRCVNNCMAFTGMDLLRRHCRICNLSRFVGDNSDPKEATSFLNVQSYSRLVPKAMFEYIPIIPRLKLLYANEKYAEKMRYPKGLREDVWIEGIRIWDGDVMKEWLSHPAGTVFY